MGPAGRNERQQCSASRVREPSRRDRRQYPGDVRGTAIGVKCHASTLAVSSSMALGGCFGMVLVIVFEVRPQNISCTMFSPVHHTCLPMVQVVRDRPGAAVRRWVFAQVLKLLVDTLQRHRL